MSNEFRNFLGMVAVIALLVGFVIGVGASVLWMVVDDDDDDDNEGDGSGGIPQAAGA